MTKIMMNLRIEWADVIFSGMLAGWRDGCVQMESLGMAR